MLAENTVGAMLAATFGQELTSFPKMPRTSPC